jgi:transcriptional regulator with XRE-family HTH domain
VTPRATTSTLATPEMKARFGKNLVRCRERADVSQEELSFRAAIHRTEVSLLERGERMPRVDTALRIAGSLGVPLDDLVAGLEWRPGYTIVVPGGWKVAERNDQTSRIPDDPAPDIPRGAGHPAHNGHNGSVNPNEAVATSSQSGTSRSSR